MFDVFVFLALMNKEEIVAHWLQSSKQDWITAKELLGLRRYLHALFFVHLSLEKICKALWVDRNEKNVPPFTHNLLKLLDEASIDLDEQDATFLADLNKFQIEGRYQDYISNIYKITNRKVAEEYFEKSKTLRKWLIKKLPSN